MPARPPSKKGSEWDWENSCNDMQEENVASVPSTPSETARSEAERRAAILRRYVAVESPSLDVDEAYAIELGLSVDALYRLARLWRHHADPALLTGARTKPTDADRAAAVSATKDPDLTGVNPSRRPLIRARIAALRAYLTIEKPTREDEKAAAELIGMSVDAFRRLHRGWVLARDPAALPGGSTPAKTPKRRSPALSAETEQVVSDTISAMGPDVSSLSVHRSVVARCEELGLRPPEKSTVYFRFVAARAAMQQDTPPAIAIDHSALALAVTGPDGVQMPVLSVIVHRPSGRVLAHDLSLDPPTAASTARLLLEFLQRDPQGADAVPLQIGAPKGSDWDALIASLADAGVATDTGPTRSLRAGHALTRTFGEAFGRLRLRPRIATRPRNVPIKAMGRGSVPLSTGEANKVVDDIVAASNAQRPTASVTLVGGAHAAELQAALNTIAALG